MSWFSELAGKAESLLEKVDTVAATALTKDQASHEPFGFDRGVSEAVPTPPPTSTPITTSVPYSSQGDIPRTGTERSVLGRCLSRGILTKQEVESQVLKCS